jgi:hypothetical protein
MAGVDVRIGDRLRNLLRLVGLVFVTLALDRPAAARAVGALSHDGCFGAAAGCGRGRRTVGESCFGGGQPERLSVYVTGDSTDGAVSHLFVGARSPHL